jgi:hypothetical protein
MKSFNSLVETFRRNVSTNSFKTQYALSGYGFVPISFTFQQYALVLYEDVSGNFLKSLNHLLCKTIPTIGYYKICGQLNRENAVCAFTAAGVVYKYFLSRDPNPSSQRIAL